MSNIEAIIVDGVRYDKVQAKTEFVCEECELRELCEDVNKDFVFVCKGCAKYGECWKARKE